MTVERWAENPYWKYFCGVECFHHAVAIDPSLMTRWRKRKGPAAKPDTWPRLPDIQKPIASPFYRADSLVRLRLHSRRGNYRVNG